MKLTIISLCAAILLLTGLSEQSVYEGTSCLQFAIPALNPFFAAFELAGYWYVTSTDDVGLPYNNYKCIRFNHVGFFGRIMTTEKAQKIDSTVPVSSTSQMIFPWPTGEYTYKTGSISQPTRIILYDGSYYVEISCTDENGSANVNVSIISRTPTMDPAKKEEIYQKLEKYGIKRSNIRDVDQSNCA